MKKFLNLILVLAMLISCISVIPVSATEQPAEPFELLDANGISFGTFATPDAAKDEAIHFKPTQVGSNFVIRLVSDITIDKRYDINASIAGTSYTLDGNGHTITYSPSDAAKDEALYLFGHKDGYTVTLKNIKINSTGGGVLVRNGTVNFVDCDITTTGTQNTIDIDTGTTSGNVEVNFISGSYESKGYCINANNHGNDPTVSCIVNIYGGYYGTVDAACAVGSFDDTVMNIYGGTFYNDTTAYGKAAAYVNGVRATTQLNIKGGNFITNHVGEASVILSNKSTSKSCELNVSGGNFKGGTLYWRDNTSNSEAYPAAADKTELISYNATSPELLGKSVRTVTGTNGLRFTSTVSKAAIDRVKALADDKQTVLFGTLIAPTATVNTLLTFTKDCFVQKGLVEGTHYVNIPAVNGLSYDGNGNATLNAALVNIQGKNLDKNLSAVAYMKATIGGREVYFYGAYNAKDDAGSIRDVATEALADVSNTKIDEYQHLVSDGSAQDGKYSPYTTAQREAMKGFSEIYKINGNSLEKYTLVYDANEIYSKHNAACLRELILSETGYLLDYKAYGSETGDYKIYVGQFAGKSPVVDKDSFGLKVEGNTLYITYSRMHGESESRKFFRELLEFDGGLNLADGYSATKTLAEVLNAQEKQVLGNTSDVRIMINNISSAHGYQAERVEMLCKLYFEYMPDVIGMQEAGTNSDKAASMQNALKGTVYKEVEYDLGTNNANFTPIFYNSDRVEVLDKGWTLYNCTDTDHPNATNNGNGYGLSKSISWAHFKIKGTEKDFVFFSTHLYYQGAAEGGVIARQHNVAQLIKLSNTWESYNCPIFGGGDMNFYKGSEAGYNDLIADGFVNARDVATNPDPAYGSVVLGDYPYSNAYNTFIGAPNLSVVVAGEIDLIFAKGSDYEIINHNIIDDDYACYGSDHRPCMIDVNLT